MPDPVWCFRWLIGQSLRQGAGLSHISFDWRISLLLNKSTPKNTNNNVCYTKKECIGCLIVESYTPAQGHYGMSRIFTGSKDKMPRSKRLCHLPISAYREQDGYRMLPSSTGPKKPVGQWRESSEHRFMVGVSGDSAEKHRIRTLWSIHCSYFLSVCDVCVCTCECVCMDGWMHVDACGCQRSTSDIYLNHFPPNFLRTDVLLSLVLTDSARGRSTSDVTPRSPSTFMLLRQALSLTCSSPRRLKWLASKSQPSSHFLSPKH